MDIPLSHRIASGIFAVILGFVTFISFILSSFEGPDSGITLFISLVLSGLTLYAVYGVFRKTHTAVYIFSIIVALIFAFIADGISAGAF